MRTSGAGTGTRCRAPLRVLAVHRLKRGRAFGTEAGAAATTQASGVSRVSLVAGRSQVAADSGQSTTARTVPPRARQAVVKASAAVPDASSRL
ncbi:hypothetical protein [Streptomyces sp. NBC_01727]|uniref:hypothetical protein n=1 Tax=unclassified Streptomyces TaxID=2593676 RepID=UPI002E10ACD7|nr:hypothetical protein OIE76_36015 [Streptomyces sp. NBC_01727]